MTRCQKNRPGNSNSDSSTNSTNSNSTNNSNRSGKGRLERIPYMYGTAEGIECMDPGIEEATTIERIKE